jgi:hypothetical protein
MIDFENPGELKRWLQTQPQTVGIALAARAALRVFPMIGRPPAAASGAPLRPRALTLADATVLQARFRAVSVAWIAFGRYAAALSVGHGVRARAILTAGAALPAGTFATDPAAVAARNSAAEAVLTVAGTGRTSLDAVVAAIGETFSAEACFGDDTPVRGALASDIAFLKDGEPSSLDDAPLWLYQPPAWAVQGWRDIKTTLENAGQDWQVWTAWYDDRFAGRVRSFERETVYIDVPYQYWEEGPEAVNARIARSIGDLQPPAPSPDWEELPAIPVLRPATLKPEWRDGRLTLPAAPAKTSLPERKFADALSALRHELRDFGRAIAGQANIDDRFVAFVQELAGRITDYAPTQEELFRLGHFEEMFLRYAQTVDGEWSPFLAARYHALALQYSRTMLQSPDWGEFLQHAAQQTYAPEQVEAAQELAREAAKALRGEAFADPALPTSLEQLADAGELHNGRPPDAVKAGKELLAVDLLESVNNILKQIAEAAMPLIAAGRQAAASAGKVVDAYAGNFEKGAIAAARKTGRKDGELAFRWLRRVAAALLAGGASAVLGGLIARFDTFEWFVRILHLFAAP